MFSVIMPAFNAAEYIEASILSVQNQTFGHWELIIVDDGSTDSTAVIVQVIAKKDSRIKYLYQSNKKQGAARNLGMSVATGKWICFLDSDDHWLPEKLHRQFELTQKSPDFDVVFSNGYTKFEDEEIATYYPYEVAEGSISADNLYKRLLINNCIPLLSVAVKKEWAEKVGPFDESPQAVGCEDHDYWLRLAKDGAAFYGEAERLFIYNVRSNSVSSNLLHQEFSSCFIRIKNLEIKRLSSSEQAVFINSVKQSLTNLKSNNRLEWAIVLENKLKALEIDLAPVVQPISNNGLKGRLASATRSTLRLILILSYFIPRKFLSEYLPGLNTMYIRWLHKNNIDHKGTISVSRTTTISIENESAIIKARGLKVMEYSFLNLHSKTSRLVTGSDVIINRFCHFNIHGKVILGNNVLFNNYCTLNCFDEIEIGDNSWFGEGVKLYDHNHQYKDRSVPFTSQGYTTGKIKIGRNVWVGSNTVILPNVEIGDRCVIGANNLIYKSIPADSIVKSGIVQPIDIKY